MQRNTLHALRAAFFLHPAYDLTENVMPDKINSLLLRYSCVRLRIISAKSFMRYTIGKLSAPGSRKLSQFFASCLMTRRYGPKHT